jgi:CDP-diacylglycerol--glycerol-3-phosphate 3-phosphatidyltransferase
MARSPARGIIVTNFGKLFDPLADKVLIAAAFILLVERTEMKAWIAIAILGREFFVTGIRLIAVQKGVVLAAERLGKHKMAWQILTVLYFLLSAASAEVALWLPAPMAGAVTCALVGRRGDRGHHHGAHRRLRLQLLLEEPASL